MRTILSGNRSLRRILSQFLRLGSDFSESDKCAGEGTAFGSSVFRIRGGERMSSCRVSPVGHGRSPAVLHRYLLRETIPNSPPADARCLHSVLTSTILQESPTPPCPCTCQTLASIPQGCFSTPGTIGHGGLSTSMAVTENRAMSQHHHRLQLLSAIC